MSGLKLVPRIPKWPSTTNGSEAASSATKRHRPAGAQRLPPALQPPPEVGDRGDRQHQHGDRRDDPVPRQPHRPPADRAEQRQPDRRRQPRPAPRPAEPDRRLPDRQRRAADRQHRCIGPDHKAASLDDRATGAVARLQAYVGVHKRPLRYADRFNRHQLTGETDDHLEGAVCNRTRRRSVPALRAVARAGGGGRLRLRETLAARPKRRNTCSPAIRIGWTPIPTGSPASRTPAPARPAQAKNPRRRNQVRRCPRRPTAWRRTSPAAWLSGSSGRCVRRSPRLEQFSFGGCSRLGERRIDCRLSATGRAQSQKTHLPLQGRRSGEEPSPGGTNRRQELPHARRFSCSPTNGQRRC